MDTNRLQALGAAIGCAKRLLDDLQDALDEVSADRDPADWLFSAETQHRICGDNLKRAKQ